MEKTLLLLAAVALLGSLYMLNSTETIVTGVPENV
jgi:C1A family cysteine protease